MSSTRTKEAQTAYERTEREWRVGWLDAHRMMKWNVMTHRILGHLQQMLDDHCAKPCKTCHAEAGMPCVTIKRGVPTAPHRSRVVNR